MYLFFGLRNVHLLQLHSYTITSLRTGSSRARNEAKDTPAPRLLSLPPEACSQANTLTGEITWEARDECVARVVRGTGATNVNRGSHVNQDTKMAYFIVK